MAPKEVKILHCADFHLGAEFTTLGEKSVQRQREILFSFERIISICKEEKVDFLLIAGDLFDHIHIDNQIYSEVVDLFRRIPDTVIAISPGNHDPFAVDSWYFTRIWPDNVVIFRNNISCIVFPEKNVCLWGGGFTSTYHPDSFLPAVGGNEIEIDREMINICVMHGDLVAQGGTGFYNPITKEQLRHQQFDYVALGHVHKRSEIQKAGKTFYSYAGSPEGHGFDEPGDLGVYIGMICKNRISLEFRKTSQRNYCELLVDISDLQTNQEIVSRISKTLEEKFAEESANNLYKIILTGEIPEYLNIDPENIAQKISASCFFAKIEDQTRVAVDYETIAKDRSLKGLFVQKMREEIEKARSSRNDKGLEAMQKALQYGLKAFEGEVRIIENK